MKPSADLERCSDEELLRRFRKGEAEAFAVLVRRYERELFGYLRRYLKDPTLAEDVFQNTFFQLFQKLEQYHADRPVRPWLYTIATHQAIDALRRNKRGQAVSLNQAREEDRNGDLHSLLDLLQAQGPSPFERLQGQERQKRVRAGVDRLPEHLRVTVILAYYQGLKYREIADVLDIPVGTVKSRLHAAILKLQEIWQDVETIR